MATTLPNSGLESVTRPVRTLSLALSRQGWSRWLPLICVFGLALAVNSWHLSMSGYGNTYYAAAVRSMTESWHNFFFGAFDPGGFITVDKPPVFLWVDALSARVFGYSSWALLLPSAIAGAAGVGLLWLIVRRYFGLLAATIAAIVLALTPITVDVSRLNLPEPFYILALIGAAGCVLMSLESKRWWAWTISAGLLVGIAFNTKMLAAWIPGPAFALAIVVGLPITRQTALRTVLRQWLPRLALLAVVTFAVSASWGLIVDSLPASERPYVGGSTDNTVTNLVFGYNGFGRIDGNTFGGGGGGRGGFFGGGGFPAVQPPANGGNFFTNPAQRGGFFPSPNQNGFGPANRFQNGGGNRFRGGGNAGVPGGNQAPANQSAAGGGNGGRPGGTFRANGAGGIIAGAPDFLRMFDAANGAQIAWFLPFALIGGLICLWRWREDPVRRGAALLLLGWVVLFGGVFSFAQGIYHSYYTSALAPGIAAIAGISTVGVADLLKRNKSWFFAAVILALATLWGQMVVTGRFETHFYSLRPYAGAIVVIGLFLLGITLVSKVRLPLVTGLVVVVAGLLFLPTVWSGYEAAHAALNTTLPQAGPRQGASGSSFGSQSFDRGVSQLATWLEEHHQPGATWDLVVSSAQNASTLIADYDVPVLALGGFSGNDPTITPAQFSQLVAAGKVRYVLASGGNFLGALNNIQRSFMPQNTGIPGFNGSTFTVRASDVGANAVLGAVERACTQVNDPSLPAQYQNAIYDCAGMASALAAQ